MILALNHDTVERDKILDGLKKEKYIEEEINQIYLPVENNVNTKLVLLNGRRNLISWAEEETGY